MDQNKNKPYRWKSLEYMRFVAIILIVCGHFLPGYFGSNWLILGGFGNAAFFALSGILLGGEWLRAERPAYGAKFLSHRIGKLMPAYYLFITIWFTFLFFAENYFSLRSLALYYAFLPWFNKLYGVGHLWFITMIVLCYIVFAVLAQVNFVGKDFIYRKRKIFLIALVPLSLIAQYFLQQKNLPAYFVAILTAMPLLFLYADRFFSAAGNRKFLWFGFFFFVGMTELFCFRGNGALRFLVFDFAMLAMICLIKLLILSEANMPQVPKIISFIAGISFEIYLVHHCLCMGKYSVQRYIPSAFLQTVVFLTATLAGAFILHRISGRILKICRRKK